MCLFLLCSTLFVTTAHAEPVALGPRPFFLIDQMKPSPLKEKLRSCANLTFKKSDFSIGHRGAPLQFPEHTVASYKAAARMGAGILECDVTFTRDKHLVCRHAQNDLHTTTDILASPLANTCKQGFSPARDGQPASAECRTSNITLNEFRSLKGKMDAFDPDAATVEDYMNGNPAWRTDLYAQQAGKLMTHAESIELFKSLGAKFAPELKRPVVEMPFKGFSQSDFAQKLVDEYKNANVPASDVWLQSFYLDDVLYWIENEPDFGKQAIFLDGRFQLSGFDPASPETFTPSMSELKRQGVNYIAPPLWVLLTVENGKIKPSAYAQEAQAAGLRIITWTLERSGPLKTGGGWYFQSIAEVADGDGVLYEMLDVLAQEVGIEGIFTDWPATVTYYANCMGLKIN